MPTYPKKELIDLLYLYYKNLFKTLEKDSSSRIADKTESELKAECMSKHQMIDDLIMKLTDMKSFDRMNAHLKTLPADVTDCLAFRFQFILIQLSSLHTDKIETPDINDTGTLVRYLTVTDESLAMEPVQ